MNVRFTRRAEREVGTILSYLNERSPHAAASVKIAIQEYVGQISDFPLSAPLTDEPGVRRGIVNGYPYYVYYRILGDELQIVHVRDARRRPWKRTP